MKRKCYLHSRLPFRYLGVPISARRISMGECNVLVEKMCARIKVWQSRNLSYSGRLQLVTSVLLSIHIYWAHIYVMHSSWYWKQICKMKEDSKSIYSENDLKQIAKFSIKTCYQKLVGENEKVH